MCRFQKCLYLILRMLPRRVTGFAEKSSSPLTEDNGSTLPASKLEQGGAFGATEVLVHNITCSSYDVPCPSYNVPCPLYNVPSPSYDGHPYPSYDGPQVIQMRKA